MRLQKERDHSLGFLDERGFYIKDAGTRKMNENGGMPKMYSFKETDQRPYPLPRRPWVMTQVWNDLLFLHYSIDPDLLRSHVPKELEIDTFKGEAWISIIPLKITGSRVRKTPALPVLSSYIELNVRTYVVYKGVPGIYFFSLDANSLANVLGARGVTALPYKLAVMQFKQKDNEFYMKSERVGAQDAYQFEVSYVREEKMTETDQDTVDFWLLERYCMYSYYGKHILRGDIHHDAWKVSDVSATIHKNTMLSFLPNEQALSEPRLLHYARMKRFLFYPLKKVGEAL